MELSAPIENPSCRLLNSCYLHYVSLGNIAHLIITSYYRRAVII